MRRKRGWDAATPPRGFSTRSFHLIAPHRWLRSSTGTRTRWRFYRRSTGCRASRWGSAASVKRDRSTPSTATTALTPTASCAQRSISPTENGATMADTSVTITMPPLGDEVTEATISRWLVAPGDAVDADAPLLEVATDKVDTEIPSPHA